MRGKTVFGIFGLLCCFCGDKHVGSVRSHRRDADCFCEHRGADDGRY